MLEDAKLIDSAFNKAAEILQVRTEEIDNKLEFICIFIALYNLNGGDEELIRHWLNTYNKHLEFKPIEHLSTSTGKILSYLESFKR